MDILKYILIYPLLFCDILNSFLGIQKWIMDIQKLILDIHK